jgi:hypothetical protein
VLLTKRRCAAPSPGPVSASASCLRVPPPTHPCGADHAIFQSSSVPCPAGPALTPSEPAPLPAAAALLVPHGPCRPLQDAGTTRPRPSLPAVPLPPLPAAHGVRSRPAVFRSPPAPGRPGRASEARHVGPGARCWWRGTTRCWQAPWRRASSRRRRIRRASWRRRRRSGRTRGWGSRRRGASGAACRARPGPRRSSTRRRRRACATCCSRSTPTPPATHAILDPPRPSLAASPPLRCRSLFATPPWPGRPRPGHSPARPRGRDTSVHAPPRPSVPSPQMPRPLCPGNAPPAPARHEVA